jgi:D-beta-D-heptose 7-phosphate kinase/D-beta-D-heptose 1-phosphate adenosyltransferase
VFDLIHRGHVAYLEHARTLGASLVVAVNTDASVRRLGKGAERPLNPLDDRMSVLAALEAVDLVVIFEEDTPIRLIAAIKPSVLVKGGDYTREQVVGHEIVEAHGGEVLLIEVLPGFSTTSLVDRARGGNA